MMAWPGLWRLGLLVACLSAIACQPAQGAVGASEHSLLPETQMDLQHPTREIRFSPWELVTALAWSPHGDILAVGAGNNLRLYRIPDLSLSKLQPLAAYPIDALLQGLAFSPDGQRLAAGSRDGRVRVWPLPSAWTNLFGSPLTATLALPKPAVDILAHKKGVNCVVFSPDGRLLASGGNDAVARLWDLKTGKRLGEFVGGTFAIPSLAFSPDGARLAIVNGALVRFREVADGRISGTLRAAGPLFGLAFSPDGKTLASSDEENGVQLWDPTRAYRTGAEHYPQPVEWLGHQGAAGTFHALVWRVTFSLDGRRLASAGGDGRIILWDLPAGRSPLVLTGHTAAVTSLAFSPDGSRLISGGLDGRVLFWDIK